MSRNDSEACNGGKFFNPVQREDLIMLDSSHQPNYYVNKNRDALSALTNFPQTVYGTTELETSFNLIKKLSLISWNVSIFPGNQEYCNMWMRKCPRSYRGRFNYTGTIIPAAAPFPLAAFSLGELVEGQWYKGKCIIVWFQNGKRFSEKSIFRSFSRIFRVSESSSNECFGQRLFHFGLTIYR